VPPARRWSELQVFLETRPFLAKLRSNAFFLMLAGYAVILVSWYAYNGVLFQFSLGLWALGFIPVTFFLGKSKQFIRELTPFIVLLLSYEALQGVAGSIAIAPVIHATTTSTVIAPYGFYQAVQSAFLSPDLTDVMTFLYGLHFPLIIVAAVLFWYSNRIIYRRYVFSLVAVSYVSLLFYVLAPSAPPWYNGVVTNLLANTSAQGGSSGIIGEFAKIGSLIESDKFAAFPSLHAAYAVLFGYFTIKLKKIYALISAPIVGGILFSTIYLGQHYLIDLVGGIAVAAAAVFIMTKTIRNQEQPTNVDTASRRYEPGSSL
jgi:membrane-associated phospholipid phosphatase